MERDQGLPPVGDQPGHQVHILRVAEETSHHPVRPSAIRSVSLHTGLYRHCCSHRPHLSSPDGSGQASPPHQSHMTRTLCPGTSKTWQPLRGDRRDRGGDRLSERSAGTVPRSSVQAAPISNSGRLHVHELREHLPAGQHFDGITGGHSYKVCQDIMIWKSNIFLPRDWICRIFIVTSVTLTTQIERKKRTVWRTTTLWSLNLLEQTRQQDREQRRHLY